MEGGSRRPTSCAPSSLGTDQRRTVRYVPVRGQRYAPPPELPAPRARPGLMSASSTHPLAHTCTSASVTALSLAQTPQLGDGESEGVSHSHA